MSLADLDGAKTWLDELADAIVAEGFPGLNEDSVLVGAPEDGTGVPDFCLGLIDRPGPTDVTYGATYPRPNLTIVLRSEPDKPQPAYLVLDMVYAWLCGQANVEWGGERFLWFEPMLSPGRLRVDSDRRTDLTCEVGVWRDEL